MKERSLVIAGDISPEKALVNINYTAKEV